MGTERSDLAYGHWREANEKFDYLVTGVSGALAAYIGQNLHPVHVSIYRLVGPKYLSSQSSVSRITSARGTKWPPIAHTWRFRASGVPMSEK